MFSKSIAREMTKRKDNDAIILETFLKKNPKKLNIYMD